MPLRPPQPRRARVLVVDDHHEVAAVVVERLEECGVVAEAVHSAEEALEWLRQRQWPEGEFDLVLCDVVLPAMSGLELLRHARQHWPLTKVALMSGYGSIDSAVEAMRCGACDYLQKPFTNDALVTLVRRALALDDVAGGFNVAAIVGEVAAAVASDSCFSDGVLDGLRRALRVVVRATGADDGEIFLCEPEGRDPLLCVWTGPDDGALVDRTRFSAGLGYPGIVVVSGKPICRKGNLADDPRYLRRAVVDAGIRSLVAVPLFDTRGVLGSLHVMSRRDDFPVERVLDVLERAAVPVASAVRAGLAALRQSVDTVCGDLDDGGRQLRVVLDLMRQVAGAQYGTLALIDPTTDRPSQVVSTGPASLVCAHAESGALATCTSLLAAHGVATQPGRRDWPEACRCGLPRRAVSPCCLPLVANGRLHGLVVLDFGRAAPEHTHARLVPLLCMASQLAIRLQTRTSGVSLRSTSETSELVAIGGQAAPELELRCFGPFGVWRRGQQIPAESFTRGKALVLLKLLALAGGAPVNRDVLIEQLWPEVDPRQGANRLHGVVHDLRSVIEPNRTDREWKYVRNRGELYYLDVSGPLEIDLVRFRHALLRGLRADDDGAAEATALLESAVDVYRGELFADEPFAEWCDAERSELREAFVDALERLARLHGTQGNDEKVLWCWRRALRASPFREDLLMGQMELLRELGRPREALAAFEEHRRLLEGDVDAEASPELLALHRRVRSAAQLAARDDAPPGPRRKRTSTSVRPLRS
ncbi:MAG: response regulator [Deltaproteobacteria bacterium]|nr:response regulator [Deltaproteobacteria bacterium]